MSRTIIIAAAASLLVAAPAFAQRDAKPAGQSTGFGGRHGSATTLRDAPRPGEEVQSGGFQGRNGSATTLREAPRRDEQARSGGFGGRNGSATDLRDTPRRGEVAGKVRVFDGRDGTMGKPNAARPGRKVPGGSTNAAPRMKSTNNLKQIGLANH